MLLRHSRLIALTALMLVALATAASAAVLWDQSAIDENGPGIANSKSPGFGGFVIYSLNDVTVPAGGWTITAIKEYYSEFNYGWLTGAAASGYLIIMPKTGALPVGAPPLTTTVPLTWSDTNGYIAEVTAGGLNVPLAAGDYWIGVSPIGPAGIDGANQQWPALGLSGVTVASYDTAWHNYYSGYDGAFKIEGTSNGSTPTTAQTWGGLKALYR